MNGKFLCLVKSEETNWIEICDVILPSTQTTSSLLIKDVKIKKVKLEETINYIFSAGSAVVGMVTNEKDIIFHLQLGSSGNVKEKTEFKTIKKPQLVNFEEEKSTIVYSPHLVIA